jgi:hypothetical protein
VLGIVHHRAIDQLRRSSVHDKRRAATRGSRSAGVGRAHRTTRSRAARGRQHPLGDGTRCPPTSRT